MNSVVICSYERFYGLLGIKTKLTFTLSDKWILGITRTIHLVEEAINRFTSNGQMVIVDPAMADDGRLYSIYTLIWL